MKPLVATSRSPTAPSGARLAGIVSVLGLLGAGFAVLLSSTTPPGPGILLAGGLALCGILALAVARLDAAVALGFALLGVVRVEPAPPDLVLMTVIAVAAVTGRFDLARVPRTAAATVAVFAGINVLSMVEVIDPVRATLFLSITLYLAIFSVWFASYLTSERRARTIVIAYLVAALSSALLALLALYTPLPGRSTFLFDAHRPEALFKDPNVLGPFLIPIALIVLDEILSPRLLEVRRSLKVAMFAVLSLGVLVSGSRAAWLNEILAVMVFLAVTGMRRGGGRRALVLLVTLLVAGAVVLETAAITGSDSFISQRASLQSYDSDRFNAQRHGIQLAQQHPLGIGPGQFEVVSPIAAHSTYIRVLSEEGFPGILTWITLVGGTLVLAMASAVRGRDTYGISSAALLAAWCGIVLNSFVVDTLHWRHLWVVAALIWAGAMRRSAPSETARASATRGPNRPS